jgi:hypothetical protein
MAKSSKPKGEKKPKAGRKLTPAEQKKLAEGVTLLKAIYADVAAGTWTSTGDVTRSVA